MRTKPLPTAFGRKAEGVVGADEASDNTKSLDEILEMHANWDEAEVDFTITYCYQRSFNSLLAKVLQKLMLQKSSLRKNNILAMMLPLSTMI